MTGLALLALLVAAAALAAAAVAAVGWSRERRRRRELDEALRTTREHARAADEARERFFDLVTHELRSPLSAILGYQELLQDKAYGALHDQAAEAVGRIGRSARHLLHLIEGVVMLSRLRSNDVQVERVPVHLGALLAPVADTFRSQACDRRIDAAVRMPEAFPTILSDQDQLVRALDLLVTSVLKHPGPDTLELDVQCHDDGATVHLRGAHLRLHDHPDPELRLGLRLAVATRVAELLGGDLLLSPPDATVVRDLAFRIRGPAADSAADSAPPFDADSRGG